MRIVLDVIGTPAPKGSARAVPLPGGRAALAPGGSEVNRRELKNWSNTVKAAANEEWKRQRPPVGVDVATGDLRWAEGAPLFVDKPLKVSLSFKLLRPSGQWGKRGLKPSAPKYPAKKPDLDKLVRSTLDALKGVIYDDDARIVIIVAWKIFATGGNEGARIVVNDDLGDVQ